MSDEPSDPKVVDRLNKFPPFIEETPDKTLEELVEEPKEKPIVEPAAETPPEEKKEEVKEEETKKRTTEQFEKLKEHNKELKQELEKEKKKNILDSLMPEQPKVWPEPPVYPQSPTTNVIPTAQQYPGVSQRQISETFDGLVDSNGYVDTGLLISTLKDLKDKNSQAEERAKQAEQKSERSAKSFDDFQRNQIMKEVHERYPTLNPENTEFDERLWKFVRNEVVEQWMNGKPTDVMGAAKEGMDTLHPESMKKADVEKIKEAETAKKNINALGASQTSQHETYTDRDELIKSTQLGRKGALAERLRRAGY